MMGKPQLSIGVDVGGTFTDFFFYDFSSGRVETEKLLTSASEPEKSIVEGIRNGLNRLGSIGEDIQSIIHGTTLIVNAIIERKGARTGLLTTKGFRDIIEARKEKRYDLYDLGLELPAPLVPRRYRIGVTERLDEKGDILTPLDESEVDAAVEHLTSVGVESLAVCFLHSYRNPIHEKRVAEIIRNRFPSLAVCLSSEVVPEIREYERFSTTVANAYTLPLISKYLNSLASRLKEINYDREVLVMLSHGGISTQETGRRYPIRLVESGPVGGVFGSLKIARENGIENILCFDMGGTTAKLCVVDDLQPSITTEYEVARVHRFKRGSGISLRLPAIDLLEIGAGGGSIAKLNSLGFIEVGPESSGSMPGPSCYGFGGVEPTVTDADLILGYLRPDYFLGGNQSIDLTAARRAVAEKIAKPLGVDTLAASMAISQTVNENMANAARIYLSEKGENSEKYTLVAFGGAGPVHVAALARALGIHHILIPRFAGVASALGFLVAPKSFETVRTYICRLESFDSVEITTLIEEMIEEGRRVLQRAEIPDDQIEFQVKADMRYVGQKHEITVPINLREKPEPLNAVYLLKCFEAEYRRIFGRIYPDIPIEALSWRVASTALASIPGFISSSSQNTNYRDQPSARRDVVESRGSTTAKWPVFRWNQLPVAKRFIGPALIEDPYTTVVVSSFFDFEMDERLSIHLWDKETTNDDQR
jgi:N-methylhydantoinase A/oxoprolinase/acetone carboxylase beta subunit